MNTKHGIYYYLGDIPSHASHAIPLYQSIGGTFVVTSKSAEKYLHEKYDITALRIDTIYPPVERIINRIYLKFKKTPRNLNLGAGYEKTFEYLNKNAKVVIFYELYKFTSSTYLDKPKTVFLTHGNMLKNYMANASRIEMIKDFDYMAALGPALKKMLSNKYVDKDKLVDIGIARTDTILRLANKSFAKSSIIDNFSLDPTKKIISYLPTYWGATSALSIGLKILENVSNRYTLIVQLHPQTPKKIMRRYFKLSKFKKNIVIIDNSKASKSVPIENIISASDLIVSDMSSVILETILIDKPLVFAYGSFPYRQTEDDYVLIIDVVNRSKMLDEENVSIVNDVFKSAIEMGINKRIWLKTKKSLFYDYNGGSVDAISKFILSLTK